MNNRLFSFIRYHIEHPKSPLKIIHIKNNKDDPIVDKVYNLRYKVLVQDSSFYDTNHPWVNHDKKQLCDPLDYGSNVDYLLALYNDIPCATMRMLNAQKGDIELDNWMPELRTKLCSNKIVEWNRVLADKNVRGSYIMPAMLLKCADINHERGLKDVVGIFDAKAAKLQAHWIKLSGAKMITPENEPLDTPEFGVGEISHVLHMDMKELKTPIEAVERVIFLLKVYYPLWFLNRTLPDLQ